MKLTEETPIFKQQYSLSQSERRYFRNRWRKGRRYVLSELLLLIGLLQ
jgi:hypothetical protein